ncbi:hypothetical protein DSR35_05830 [Salmonella enterica subsp. enterica serovar Newport]|nr:hypothetical protein [Salmonella enterica subsp. enterica serovar Newport]
MALNLFDLLNEARRLTELSGAVLQKSKRYPQRYALRTTPPKREMPGEVEITVCNKGVRRLVHAARVGGCTVYWED